MHRYLLALPLLAACSARQTPHTFTAALTPEQATCRAENLLRSGPWHVESDAEQGEIYARPAASGIASLLGTAGEHAAAPTTWTEQRAGGSYDVARSQSVERKMVIAITATQEGSARVKVSMEDVACIVDGTSLHGACSVSYPANHEIQENISTVGRALRMWMRQSKDQCVRAPAAGQPETAANPTPSMRNRLSMTIQSSRAGKIPE